ncbi:MAG: hypothetical protein IT233_05455 [Bacteroidia bacterium]|nr:hypothetical protein [Bacteroidia bacterium]
MRTEPKTILYFLWHYYEPIQELFDAQSRDGYIRKETLKEICGRHGHDIEGKLTEYKILKNVNTDYEFRTVFYGLLEFIMNEFKPMLPETIEKYHHSISELFRKIRKGVHEEKFILMQRLTDLTSETRDFSEGVENNTLKLLAKTRELKANMEKVDYRDKIRKASEWIEYYILPMNKILDIHHTSSIANKLFEIANFANEKRLLVSEEQTRQAFEKLYYFLLQTNDDLLRQSKILTNELLPLIERIRTESIILSGFIEFLKDPFDVPVPQMLKTSRDMVYNRHMELNATEFWEQFERVEKVYINEAGSGKPAWLFDREAYKDKLDKSLPVEDFFDFLGTEWNEKQEVFDEEKFFAFTTLLFEEDLKLEFPDKSSQHRIRTENMTYRVPKIKVDKNGIF